VLVPVNTRVTLWPKRATFAEPVHDRETINFVRIELVDSKKSIRIHNIAKHSALSLTQIMYRMFSPEPIDLEIFDEEIREQIVAGAVSEGMTKYQVLLARGYPPGHRTPSLGGDTWLYWSSRRLRQSLTFKDGRLAGVVP
jgi:hypothetical protein